MMVQKVMFSSASGEWETPQWLFDLLDDEFDFTLDPCASNVSAKCDEYMTVEEDGLSQEWDGRVFVNPPYGRAIRDWVKKSYDESQHCEVVVMLIPARTDTLWWHSWIHFQASELRFISGRLRFGNATNAAPFPSVVVIFWPDDHAFAIGPTISARSR